MLMQRVLTALVLLPILLALVWLAPTPWLYLVLAAVGLIMAWEWTAFMGLAERRNARLAYLAVTAVMIAATWFSPINGPELSTALLPVAIIWLLMPLRLRRYPESGPVGRPALALGGLLMIASTLISIAALHGLENGPAKLLYTLFVVFAADTGAYFAGRAFGKHKLAPAISPGKTVEGALGGLALVAVFALVAGSWVFGLREPGPIAALVLLSLVVAAVSIVGDLTESMLKRSAGLKDSGNILPGHGGILDRTDSIVAAVPVMVLGLHLCGLA